MFEAAVFLVGVLSGATAAVVGFGIGSMMTPLEARLTEENARQACQSQSFIWPATAGERLFRDAVLSLVAEHEWSRAFLNTGRASVAMTYEGSPLSVPDAKPLIQRRNGGRRRAGLEVGEVLEPESVQAPATGLEEGDQPGDVIQRTAAGAAQVASAA